jgi:XTP/dITP diphosphohydrolase
VEIIRPPLLLGSRNEGKLLEIKTLLRDIPYEVRSLNDFPEVAVAPEDGVTYEENAIAKAKFYAAATGLTSLADDSGLEVVALGGRPGVHSARYAGDNATDADRRQLLLSELGSVSDRAARFVCAVAISSPDGRVLGLFEGICGGHITTEEKGTSGFGYDPIFIPDGHSQTFGELSEDIKNRISHRARALISARMFLTGAQPQ